MQADFSLQEVISLMKKTKKTDPLFKPLKKLKTAIEGIGVASLSLLPTTKIILFHFGLGNQVDRQFVNLTDPQDLAAKVTIIPGHSYTVLHFTSTEASQRYLQSKTKIGERPVSYAELQYQNLSRILIFLYCKDSFTKEVENAAVPDCSSIHQKDAIPGLHLYQSAVTREEQANLLKHIDGGEWEKLNNRRVQHYGYKFKYGRNQIDRDEKEGILPPFLDQLLAALNTIPVLTGATFDQLTINDYFAGNGIPSHFDTHSPFEEVFISVSLLSGIVMDFKRFDGEEKSVYLPQRSVAVFSGEARFAWTHGIACRKIDMIDGQIQHRSRRLSLTFRKIKFTPCKCPFYFYCDSQGYEQETMKKSNPLLAKYMSQQHSQALISLSPQQIEKEFVEKAYNGFGFDFHNKVIPQIKDFIQRQIKEGDVVLDLGCGNSQYSKYIPKGSFYVGVEKCRSMFIGEEGAHMDGLNLGLREAVFDEVLLVAVLHHFASEETRLKTLKEVFRVLDDAGTLYLSVLSYENKKEVYSTPQTLLEYCLPANKAQQKKEKTIQQNVQVPRLQQRGEVFKRYYHLFTVNEITYLLKCAHFQIVELLLTGQNIIVKAVKQSNSLVKAINDLSLNV